MESALFSASATRCGGCAAAAGGVCVAVMEQWEFPFVPSVSFQPASGPWLRACGDFFCVFYREQRSRQSPIRWRCPLVPKAKSRKSQTSQFCVCDFCSFWIAEVCVAVQAFIWRAQPGGCPAVAHSPINRKTPLWPAWPSLTSLQSSATSAISSYWSAFGQVVSMMVGTGGRTE